MSIPLGPNANTLGGGGLTQSRGEAESAERKIETMTEGETTGDISKRILSP